MALRTHVAEAEALFALRAFAHLGHQTAITLMRLSILFTGVPPHCADCLPFIFMLQQLAMTPLLLW
jgi:hypothetical protein